MSLTLTPRFDTASTGTSVQYTAVVRDQNGQLMTATPVWSVDNTQVATVSTSGLLVARNPGWALIRATVRNPWSNVTGKASLLVVRGTATASPNPVASVTVSPSQLNLRPSGTGNTATLTAQAYDGSAVLLGGTNFAWRSTNDSIASVSPGGTVTARRIGSALIIVAATCCGGPADSATVVVTEPTSNPPSTPSLSVGAITSSGATLTGSPFADPDVGGTHASSQWQVDVAAGNFSSPVFNSGAVTTGLTTQVVTGLNASTAYKARVRYMDNTGVWSVFSAAQSFTTTATAPNNSPPSTPSLSVSGVTTSGATLSGSPFADPNAGNTHSASEWQVDQAGGDWASLAGGSGTTTTSLTSYAVTGLAASTNYQARVRYRDNNNAWSGWSATQTFATTGGTPPPPPPPPPTGGYLFTSDWSTARGTSSAAKSDGGKWQIALSSDQYNVGEVVAGTEAGFPSANALRVRPVAAQSALRLINNNLGQLPQNTSRFYRFYFRVDHPRIGDSNNHPIETSTLLSGTIAWAFRTNVITDNTWTAQLRITGTTVYESPVLQHHVPYRFEFQLERLTGMSFRLHARIYDMAGTLIAGDDRWHLTNGSGTLSTNPILQFAGLEGLAGMQVGLNGVSNSDWHPSMLFGYQGAVCIRTDTWCGAYVPGEGR
jgi:hypothetical protein